MQSPTRADGISVRYVGTLEAGASLQGDDGEAAYVKVPRGMMHEMFGLQRDILKRA